MSYSNELRQKRASVIDKMQELSAKVVEEKRTMTDEENQQLESMQAESASIRRTYEQIEATELASRELGEFKDAQERAEHQHLSRVADADTVVTRDDRDKAFRAWAIAASADVSAVPEEFRNAAEKCNMVLGSKSLDSLRWSQRPTSTRHARKMLSELQYRATTPQSLVAGKGGNTTTDELVMRLEVQLAAYGGIREACQVIRTDHGNGLDFPMADDTSNSSSVLAINVAASISDLTFTQRTIGAAKYSTGIVLVPMELLQDTGIDLIAYIGDALGTRAARGVNTAATTNSTGNSITGLVTRISGTVTATSGATRRPTFASLKSLEHAVDPAYRGNASWMMSDEVLHRVEALVDSQGNPIFRTSNDIGTPDRIFGYPVVVNQAMSSSTGTGAKIVAFGDMSKYVLRDVADITSLRLDERYAEKAQTGWMMFHRHGGDTIFATTTAASQPIQAMVQAT